MRTPLLTAGALAAFAANSVLCRLALGGRLIDAASFTSVRLAAGACVLLLIKAATNSRAQNRGKRAVRGQSGRSGEGRGGGLFARLKWSAAGWLFLYASAFSFAYLGLGAGVGALILFGSVQATMLLGGVRAGERPGAQVWTGVALALAGLVYLVLPGLSAPAPGRALLMSAAGIAWGCYSLGGQRRKSNSNSSSGATANDPLAATTANFVAALPLALLLNVLVSRGAAQFAPTLAAHLPASLAAQFSTHISARGVLLAVASGAVASGVGYVVWYAALRELTATRAAAVQLLVPVLAAAGGIGLLGERLTGRLVWAAAVILGGVGLAVSGRARTRV